MIRTHGGRHEEPFVTITNKVMSPAAIYSNCNHKKTWGKMVSSYIDFSGRKIRNLPHARLSRRSLEGKEGFSTNTGWHILKGHLAFTSEIITQKRDLHDTLP